MSGKVLVLTLSFGSGHVRAAEAVAAEFRRRMPDAEIKIIDALENCSLAFRAFYVWTYWAMIRHAPAVWDKFFHARTTRKDEHTAPVWVWRKGCAKIFAEIENFQPNLIVACEVGACEIAVIARRENLTDAKIINVITDFEAEPIWVKPEIAAFAVPNEQVAAQLESWGAPAEIIKVCGIPLDASFSARHDAEKVRKRFGFDARPIVLLMGGGMGPTEMDKVATRLLQADENLQIAALPGRDKRAKRELEKLLSGNFNSSAKASLKIFGWTNEVAALMQTAAVLATKPGGVTLSEAAICGIPLVLFDAIPGLEETNAERFVEAGAGILTRGSDETAQVVLELLRDEGKIKEMTENVKKLAQPDAAREIVNLAMQTAFDGQISFVEREKTQNRLAVGV